MAHQWCGWPKSASVPQGDRVHEQPVTKGIHVKNILAATAAAALLLAAPAMAQTKISGNYLVTIHKFCQLVATYNFGSANNVGNFVNGIDSSGSDIKMTILQANFSKGTVTMNGLDDGGDVEIFQFTGAQSGQLGNAIAETTDSGTAPY